MTPRGWADGLPAPRRFSFDFLHGRNRPIVKLHKLGVLASLSAWRALLSRRFLCSTAQVGLRAAGPTDRVTFRAAASNLLMYASRDHSEWQSAFCPVEFGRSSPTASFRPPYQDPGHVNHLRQTAAVL